MESWFKPYIKNCSTYIIPTALGENKLPNFLDNASIYELFHIQVRDYRYSMLIKVDLIKEIFIGLEISVSVNPTSKELFTIYFSFATFCEQLNLFSLRCNQNTNNSLIYKYY